MRKLYLLFTFIVLVVGLAACGGGQGDETGVTQEDQAGVTQEDQAGIDQEDQAGASQEDEAGAGQQDKAGASQEDESGVGPDDEPGASEEEEVGASEDDEAGVDEAIERFSTNANPAACKALATQRFLEEIWLNVGKEAVQRCEEAAAETADDPKSITVSRIEVSGSSATADAAFEGGRFDGQTLSVGLVEEGGRWKLDTVTVAEFDKERFVRALEEALEAGGFEAQLAACVGGAIRSLPDQRAEELVVGGSQKPILAILSKCSREVGP